MSINDNNHWSIQKILNWTTRHFALKEIPSARLDAELLLAHALGCRRLDLYLKFDQPMFDEERTRFKEFVKRRASFEPVAYILGSREFYGRNFAVGPGVLIPRPETEHIVDEVLRWKKSDEQRSQKTLKVLDVATGSGCLAATLACEIPNAEISAVDISQRALIYAHKNIEALGVAGKTKTFKQDFLEWAATNMLEGYDIIVSNPPYVANDAKLMLDVKEFEPPEALFGGQIGVETICAWLPAMVEKLKPEGILLCEMGFDQKTLIEERFANNKEFVLTFVKDYSGHDRIIKIVKKVQE